MKVKEIEQLHTLYTFYKHFISITIFTFRSIYFVKYIAGGDQIKSLFYQTNYNAPFDLP